MRSSFLIPVVLITAACTASEQLAHAAPAAVVPLDLSGERPAVSLSIGDQPPSLAVFDTGAMDSVIDTRFLAASRAAPAEPGAQVTISNARLGDFRVPPFQADVIPMGMLPDRVGVMSPNEFMGDFVTLDFATSQLRITPKAGAPEPRGQTSGYSAEPFSLPTLQVRVGSQTVEAHIDTGSPVTLMLPRAMAETLPLSEPLVERGRARGHTGDFPIFHSRIAGTVQVGPLSVENPEVTFSDVVPRANVGMGLLRSMTITLDPETKRVWTVANSG